MDTITFIKKHFKTHQFVKNGYDDTKPVDPNEMLKEIKKSFKQNKLTDRAVELIESNIDNMFKSYIYKNEDDRKLLRSIILFECIAKWRNFNVERKSDAFSFFRSICATNLHGNYSTIFGKRNRVMFTLDNYFKGDDN